MNYELIFRRARLISYFVGWQLKAKETSPIRNYCWKVRASFKEKYSSK